VSLAALIAAARSAQASDLHLEPGLPACLRLRGQLKNVGDPIPGSGEDLDGDGVQDGPASLAGVVLTTPPFPYPRPQVEEPVGLPVLFDGELTAEDRQNLHYCEVGLENAELVTSGIYGWAMVATGVGESISTAQQRANRLADRVIIPNIRYRRDIGERLMAEDLARIESLDVLDAA